MKIGVIGSGYMGRNYARSLVEKQHIVPRDIVCIDVDEGKAATLAGVYGTEYRTKIAADIEAAIVAVNTPAHHTVIEELLKCGTRHILCEKPLAQNRRRLGDITQAIRKYGSTAQLWTALVINFSPALLELIELMDREDLQLLDFHGYWGKNRGLSKEKRPTAGDVEDESIHIIGFLLALIRAQEYRDMYVSAQVGYLPFVDPEAQELARKRDISFPSKPSHSTAANLRLVSPRIELKANIYSSFLLPSEIRTIGGVLGRAPLTPVYSFRIDFDTKKAADGSSIDALTLTRVREGDKTVKEFPNDKLNDMVRAFLRAANGESVDSRLASVKEAGALVSISDAIIASDEHDGAIQRVYLV